MKKLLVVVVLFLIFSFRSIGLCSELKDERFTFFWAGNLLGCLKVCDVGFVGVDKLECKEACIETIANNAYEFDREFVYEIRKNKKFLMYEDYGKVADIVFGILLKGGKGHRSVK